MTFANAVKAQKTTTENGMVAFKSTMSACVDLFGKIAALRNQDPIPAFVAAYNENREIALRIVQWARDIRGGAGERETYRKILKYLEKTNPNDAKLLASNTPVIGRWDDILVFEGDVKEYAFNLVLDALKNKNGLAAKWMPRKGDIAVALTKHFGFTPRFYRKTLVELSKTVEQQMCAKQWEDINFEHVPSVASSRYKKAFTKHQKERYSEYLEAVVKGEKKMNASAVFPHDVVRLMWNGRMNATERKSVVAQWDSLPNYVGDANILPVVDVSGSMDTSISGSLTALQVAISLGLYLADKNKGAFNGCFVNFSSQAKVEYLKGDVVSKYEQMARSHWDMSTNLEAAFKNILKVAVDGMVAKEDMPKYVLILSDMQFDQCAKPNYRAMDMIAEKYAQAGYDMPNIIFWNLNARDNVPVRFDEKGTALVSGYSPALLTAILAADSSKITPEGIMLSAVMKDKYVV